MNDMFEKFLKLITEYSVLNEEEVEFVRANIPIKSYSKNEIIFNEGNISQTIYYVLEGCVRLFYNVDGNEKTAFFYTEGKFMCANESFLKGTPARENFQVLEKTTLMHFDKSIDSEFIRKSPNFELIDRLAIIDELINSNRLIESFVTKTPQERYLDLLKSNNDIFQRVPQQYIASYLGISPESLSRIRKRIANSSH